MFTGSVSPACQSDSGISHSETGGTGSTGPHQHAAASEFNFSPTLSAYRLPSPEIPHFDCQPYYYFHLSENGSVSPDSIMLERDCTNSCLDTLFDEIRPDSPESIVFDSECQESFRDMPSDSECTQSFLHYCLSELRPSSPQILESIGDLDDVSNQLPCGQSLPEETSTADKFKDL